MIEVFEGRIGGYKTYSAVERMLKYIAQGGSVFTNIELKLDGCRIYLREKYLWDLQDGQYNFLKDEQVSEFHRHTPPGTPDKPVLVVLDEAHIWFNARDWSQTSRELLAFLTQSRKQSTDVIFISQSLLNLDKQFMRLVQYVWTFRDLQKIVMPGIRWLRYPFRHILQCQWDYDGKSLQKRYFVPKDSRIYACYNTFVLLRSFPRLESVATNFQGKGRVRVTWRYAVRRAALVPVLLGVLCVGGCRYVQVDDVRQQNKKLQVVVAELQVKIHGLESRSTGVRAGAVTNLASFGGGSGGGAGRMAVATSSIPCVVAVVDGRCGLSSGRWVYPGEFVPGFGTLLDCCAHTGRSRWLLDDREVILFL